MLPRPAAAAIAVTTAVAMAWIGLSINQGRRDAESLTRATVERAAALGFVGLRTTEDEDGLRIEGARGRIHDVIVDGADVQLSRDGTRGRLERGNLIAPGLPRLRVERFTWTPAEDEGVAVEATGLTIPLLDRLLILGQVQGTVTAIGERFWSEGIEIGQGLSRTRLQQSRIDWGRENDDRYVRLQTDVPYDPARLPTDLATAIETDGRTLLVDATWGDTVYAMTLKWGTLVRFNAIAETDADGATNQINFHVNDETLVAHLEQAVEAREAIVTAVAGRFGADIATGVGAFLERGGQLSIIQRSTSKHPLQSWLAGTVPARTTIEHSGY